MFVGRKRWVRRVLFAVAIFWSTTVAVGRAQTGYTYTVIADLAGCSQFHPPAINNKGEVAFGAVCGSPIGPPGGVIGIWRGDGGTLTPIYTWTSSSGTQHVPDITVLSMNDSGVLAFAVNGPCPNRGAAAIWTGDGQSINTVHDICTDPGFTSVLRPSINNAGSVTFMAASGQSYDTVVRVSNGTTVTIAGPGTSTTVGTLNAAIEPSINNNGVVAFMGLEAPLNSGGIFTGFGGPITTISLNNPSIFNAIDDSGRVAFSSNGAFVQTGDGGPVVTIAATSPTGFQSFGQVSISAGGKVAFSASLPTGVAGVFTGSDPQTDVVLQTGDFFPGFGTITFVQTLRESINDSGQIAMLVLFNDNGVEKRAIVRADPPNNPPVASDGSVSLVAGGSVSGTLSGTDPNSEPITYAIVRNGAKGAAVIDNASTGAFTYTANADASGNDTFTFQVTDIRGLGSNVATITVDIQPLPACAVNVTTSITQKKPATKNGGTIHRLSLTNTATAIAGPISLVLDSLSPAWTLVNAAGVTACTQPTGSPYVNVDVGADSIWSTGEQVEVILEFSLASSGPGKKPALSYTRRVLAGTGAR
jgi:hypothetical protein